MWNFAFLAVLLGLFANFFTIDLKIWGYIFYLVACLLAATIVHYSVRFASSAFLTEKLALLKENENLKKEEFVKFVEDFFPLTKSQKKLDKKSIINLVTDGLINES